MLVEMPVVISHGRIAHFRMQLVTLSTRTTTTPGPRVRVYLSLVHLCPSPLVIRSSIVFLRTLVMQIPCLVLIMASILVVNQQARSSKDVILQRVLVQVFRFMVVGIIVAIIQQFVIAIFMG